MFPRDMSALVLSAFWIVVWLLAVVPAQAGHEFPFYPSFYPQEITIEATAPDVGAERLAKGSLHAYVGGDPFREKPAPANVAHVEFLGSYVVVTLNTASGLFPDRQARCAAAHKAVDSLAAGAYTFHPYPITPYHSDFLQHFDLSEAAKREYRAPRAASSSGPPLRIRTRGALAEKLVPSGARAHEGAWDASVEGIDVADLLSSRGISLNGWLGPPWIKDGWFHAFLLLAGTVVDSGAKQVVDAAFRRLVTGNYVGPVERLNLERQLVSLLRGSCERVVVGYTVKREYFNTDYSGGVENIGHDSHAGFNSPIFLRTVKLKDFPWNGWLNLGIQMKPSAAWNPVGGLTDATGRLIWFALGDPALLPSPHSGSWVPNRVTATLAGIGGRGIEVPPDALIPEPGTGLLRKVAPGTRAGAKVEYRVLTSAFHDGTRMSPGDVIYPFVFTYRWGVTRGQREYDPVVDAATAVLRERLAGLRLLRVERDVLAFGDVMKLTYEVPIVEAYVNYQSPDPLQVAALAPPWSTLPWHLMVLMEAAVTRGLAAFSRDEARRRGIAWMDLARDQKLKDALVPLLDEFARRNHVPETLKGLVTASDARERWSALRHFYDKHQHFLVTNGPYRLHQWSGASVVLQVFRDLTFPRGVGSFDRYAFPLRAYVSKTERRGDELEIQAEVERVERFGREYRIVTEPFSKKASEQDKRSLPTCRFVVVGPDGAIVKAGTVKPTDASTFGIPLTGTLKPGPHTILFALDLDGNHVNQRVKAVSWTP
ncbi:MAG: hypothetical protein HY724_11200 [Candidatus Rokubacteria bacterium]|nr:hypothetical protein [Candidatus Rokubacteria bacterium]